MPKTKRKEQLTLQKITQQENHEQELIEPEILA